MGDAASWKCEAYIWSSEFTIGRLMQIGWHSPSSSPRKLAQSLVQNARTFQNNVALSIIRQAVILASIN